MNYRKLNIKIQKMIEVILVIVLVFVINIIGNYVYKWFDLTEEKIFTLTASTEKAIEEVVLPVFIDVLMGGTYPAGFSRLQSSTQDLLNQFRSVNPLIEYRFTDPSEGTTEEVNEFRKDLAEDGIHPVNLRFGTRENITEKLIYPFAFIRIGSNYTIINMLDQKIAGVSDEENLNNSISLLEYKFISAIEKLKKRERDAIAFTTGHGELSLREIEDFANSVSNTYVTRALQLDSVTQISDKIKVLIVAKPQSMFSDKDKFKIDQYIMNGGKVLFLIDKVNAAMDSIPTNSFFVPDVYSLNLDDLLFKYGVRVNNDLVMDMECSDLVLVIGSEGGRPQMERFDWFYDPIVSPKSTHPIVKGLDRVNMKFVSSIDTVKTATATEKTVLLSSSDFSRLQFSPIRITFELLRNPPGQEVFNKKNIPLAVLVEGELGSLYSNRVTPEMNAGLEQMGQKFVERTTEGKVLVVADGDVIRNEFHPTTGVSLPLGFNKNNQYTFANKPFLINAIEYLVEDNGVIESRSKTVKLRLLDMARIDREQNYWKTINIVLPLVFVGVFGAVFTFVRRRRFAS